MSKPLAKPIARRVPLPERGVEIALLDWGGEGPLLFMHHANGFCAGTLGLVAQALVPDYRVIGMDARGHGDSSKPEGPAAYEWHHFAEDYLAVAERLAQQLGAARVVGLGHSFGGTAALGATARRPALFERLVLVDPVIPLPELAASIDPERMQRLSRLVDGARKRRTSWASRDEAREHFAARSLFERWLPEAIELYLEHGLRECADGSLELKCPGEVEAAIFASGRGFDVLDLARRARVPATFLWAERGDFPRATYEKVAGVMERARIVDVASGHLVPMEHPELVADAVRAGE
jgi:pimeloyl-ACP methyl ester carboxylesterase